MTRAKALWICAAIANALGWALPVIDDESRGVYRGFHAFRVALSPLWPYEEFHLPQGYFTWLSIASAFTNVLFVALAVYLWPRVARSAGSHLAVYALGAAALLNLHWTVTMQDSADDLAIGYYVWVMSFVLLLLAGHPALARRSS
jgi:hypothetical protein